MKAKKKATAAKRKTASSAKMETRQVSRKLERSIGALCRKIDEVVQHHTDEALRGRDDTSVDVFLALCSATDQLHVAVAK